MILPPQSSGRIRFVLLVVACLLFQVASELNAALLRAENADCTQPRLASVLKMLLWSQSELDKKGVAYPKMYDLATGETKDSK